MTGSALSVQEAATRFGVSADVVYDEIAKRRLPAFKAGRQWRITAAAAADYERACDPAVSRDDLRLGLELVPRSRGRVANRAGKPKTRRAA